MDAIHVCACEAVGRIDLGECGAARFDPQLCYGVEGAHEALKHEHITGPGSSDPARPPGEKRSIPARTLEPIDNIATSKPY